MRLSDREWQRHCERSNAYRQWVAFLPLPPVSVMSGESVPQMKDAMGAGTDSELIVDCFGKHRRGPARSNSGGLSNLAGLRVWHPGVIAAACDLLTLSSHPSALRIHALFSGTSLIQTTAPERSRKKVDGDASSPPDDGILCFVLRTGFNSSQGELMRMIEFSTENVSADTVETTLQLMFLLVFALAAAGYVMNAALKDPTRPTYKTLIRCTQIITSVVPPSLPMQMAFAVNTALMSLLKAGIYCTEPFRVPFAGRVSHCFFDKRLELQCCCCSLHFGTWG